MWETSRNKLKKHSVTKNCSDLSLFEQIVLVISKFLQILGLQPWISKVFLDQVEQFFLTIGQNNFGNKIPFLRKTIMSGLEHQLSFVTFTNKQINFWPWLWSRLGTPIKAKRTIIKTRLLMNSLNKIHMCKYKMIQPE